jgi:hypothetical protein
MIRSMSHGNRWYSVSSKLSLRTRFVCVWTSFSTNVWWILFLLSEWIHPSVDEVTQYTLVCRRNNFPRECMTMWQGGNLLSYYISLVHAHGWLLHMSGWLWFCQDVTTLFLALLSSKLTGTHSFHLDNVLYYFFETSHRCLKNRTRHFPLVTVLLSWCSWVFLVNLQSGSLLSHRVYFFSLKKGGSLSLYLAWGDQLKMSRFCSPLVERP